MKTLSFVLLVVVIASALVNAANNCTPVSYNGQSWSLNNPKQLMGFFPNIAQTGDWPGTWSWVLSLCDPTMLPPNATLCSPPSYVTQVNGPTDPSGCIVYNPYLLDVTYNTTYGALQFRYDHPSASLQDTVYCFCSNIAGLRVIGNTDLSIQGANFHQIFNVSSPACCPDNGPTTPPSPTSTSSPAGNKCKAINVNNGKATIPFTEAAQLQGTFNGVNLQYNGQNINTNWQFSLCSTFADSNAKSGQAFITADVSGKNYFGEITAQPTFDQASQQVMIKYSGFLDALPMDLSVFVVCNPFQETLQMSGNNVVVTQDPNTYLLSARVNFVSAGACPRPN